MLWWLLAACTGGEAEEVPPPEPTGTPSPDRVGEPLLRFADGQIPRNVLMISIDTLRKDAIGRYSGDDWTPLTDAWLEGAVVLDDHQQCSNWTFASTSCTLNGRYHEDNGFLPKLGEDLRAPLPDGRYLAGELQAAGFYTMLVSTNDWLGPSWNNAQGYDETPFYGYGSGTFLTESAFFDLGERVAAGEVDRWMVHVHWVEPHAPYTPPAHLMAGLDDLDPLPFDLDTQAGHYAATDLWPDLTDDERALLEAHLRIRYEGEVRWVDAQLSTVLASLEEQGWLDDTLIVLWTDHGEQFWEHGEQSHAHSLYAEENDGILAFRAPGLEPVAWPEPTHGIDLLPTMLEALELPLPDDLKGVPVGTAPPDRATFTVVSARDGAIQAVTRDRWKLHFSWADGSLALFDRRTDPAETTDLYRPDHPEVSGLWAALVPHIVALEPLVPERTVTWPEGLPRPP